MPSATRLLIVLVLSAAFAGVNVVLDATAGVIETPVVSAIPITLSVVAVANCKQSPLTVAFQASVLKVF